MRTLFAIVAVGLALSLGAVLGVWGRRRRRRRQAVRAPVLGVLRLNPEAGRLWETEDRVPLAALFPEVRESDRDIPRCDVLLIYGTLDTAGRFGGTNAGLREIIRDAGAKVVIVASDNAGPNYIAAGRQTGYGLANLVMVLDRKGELFPPFVRRLFTSMYEGVSMPEAWVKMAPQVSGAHQDSLPESIFACELGDLTFERPAPAA